MTMDDQLILVVEDDPNDVLLLRRAFKKAEITNPVDVAEDGDQAVDYLTERLDPNNGVRQRTPSLVLLDLKLPRRSGLEVLTWRATLPGAQRIPFVVLTSSRQSVDLERAYALGTNGYLVKPESLTGLTEMATAIRSFWLTYNTLPDHR